MKIATLLTGSLLTLVIASYGFAADNAAAVQQQGKPAITAAATPAAPPQAPATATPAAPANVAPATAAPAVTAPTAAAPTATVKLGYVNMMKLAQESKTGKAATDSMNARSDKLRAKIDAKRKQLEKQKAAIEAKIDTFSAKERVAKGKEFQKKVEEFQKLVRTSEEEMGKMQDKLTSELVQNVKAACAAYAKSHGYAAILEEKSLLYVSDAAEARDVTDDIAAAIDEKKGK